MTLLVAVAGAGTIGALVASEVGSGRVEGCRLGAVLDSSSDEISVAAALDEADVLVEATNPVAARGLLLRATSAGAQVVLCSGGVLADHDLEADLRERGVVVGSQVLLPPGAIGGLDILAAAARGGAPGSVRVRHTTTKRPAALGVPAGLVLPTEVFRGTAREAALAYPLTSNSSVTLALATAGLDDTEVVVVADPRTTSTRHRIELTSPLGSYDFTIDNVVSSASGGRTSEITAWSVVEVLATLARWRTVPEDAAADGGPAPAPQQPDRNATTPVRNNRTLRLDPTSSVGARVAGRGAPGGET